jgi:lipopolysaccharide/colanic/teichoic acid biosynthesis glycosyltransferase
MQQLAHIGPAPALRVQDEHDRRVSNATAPPTDVADRQNGTSLVQIDEPRLRRLVGAVADADETPATTSEATGRDRIGAIGDLAVAVSDPFADEHRDAVPTGIIGRQLKRGIDIVGSAALLAALSPVLATCVAAVRLSSPGPILFRQKRIGQNGQPFTMLKFRTMYDNSDQRVHEAYVKKYIAGAADGHDDDAGATVFKLVGDARVTRPGHWLRKMSLDELPQLINVLRGDMSLVGPRPPLPYEVEHYRPRDLQRLRAGPGITGLWQVSGRNKMTFDQMIDLDLEYIRRWSLALDLRILQRTIPVVLFPDGH